MRVRAAATKPHGTVSVLNAGSLVKTMERDLGPAVTRADRYSFEQVGARSTERGIAGRATRGGT